MTSASPVSYHIIDQHNSEPDLPTPGLNPSRVHDEPKKPQPREDSHNNSKTGLSPPSARLPLILATFEDWWIWEIAGLLGSAAALVAVAILLNHFDHRQQPDWDGVSLNTVVSWLSTVAKLLAFIPLSKSIGQLKWIWLARNKKPLADLAVFDAASRGALGSCQLLWTVKGRHFAIVGALATVLAIGFDPFNQNLIHYYQQAVEDTNIEAVVASSSYYDTVGPLVGASFHYIDPVMKSNIYSSIFNPTANQTWGQPELVCSTGNCTYPTVVNLDVRSLCSNITSDLSMNCTPSAGAENCTLGIDQGVSLWFRTGNNSYGGIPLIVSALSYGQQPRIYRQKAPILTVVQWIYAQGLDANQGASMLLDLNKDTQFVATECALEVIARGSNISVNSNIYQELHLNTSNELISVATNPNNDAYWTFQPPWLSDLGYDPSTNFTLGWTAWNAIQAFLSTTFKGYVQGASDSLGFYAGTPAGDSASSTAGIGSDVVQALFVQDFTSGSCGSHSDKLTCMMQNVARAMTKTFRDAPYVLAVGSESSEAQPNTLAAAANMTAGKTWRSATFVRIQWEWLSLPGLVWLLTAITWLGTVLYTWMISIPKWGNNVLPLVFLYREGQEKETHGMNTEKAFIMQAQATRAKLYVDNNRQKVMLA